MDGAEEDGIVDHDDHDDGHELDAEAESDDGDGLFDSLSLVAAESEESDPLPDVVIKSGSAADEYRRRFNSDEGIVELNRLLALENDIRDPEDVPFGENNDSAFVPPSNHGRIKRFTGSVKSYNNKRGYGFLKIDGHLESVLGPDKDKDIFFHWKQVSPEVYRQALVPGRKIVFELGATEKGPTAKKYPDHEGQSGVFRYGR